MGPSSTIRIYSQSGPRFRPAKKCKCRCSPSSLPAAWVEVPLSLETASDAREIFCIYRVSPVRILPCDSQMAEQILRSAKQLFWKFVAGPFSRPRVTLARRPPPSTGEAFGGVGHPAGPAAPRFANSVTDKRRLRAYWRGVPARNHQRKHRRPDHKPLRQVSMARGKGPAKFFFSQRRTKNIMRGPLARRQMPRTEYHSRMPVELPSIHRTATP